MRAIIAVLLVIAILASCQQQTQKQISEKDLEAIARSVVICDAPYIRHSMGCCLDQDNNSVCDADQPIVNQTVLAQNTTNTTNTTAPTLWQSTQVANGGGDVAALEFASDEPPEHVYDKSRTPFNITVLFKNVGVLAVGPDTDRPFVLLQLDGILPALFSLEQTGVRLYAQQPIGTGQQYRFVFGPARYIGNLPAPETVLLRGNACFDYETTASARVCVLDQLFNDKACLSLTQPVKNTAGPVYISQMTQTLIDRDKTLVSFTVAHRGSGTFFGRLPTETCNMNPTNMNKYNLSIEVLPLTNGTMVNCQRFGNESRGSFVLYGGVSQIFSCMVTRAPRDGASGEDLNVTLRYRYQQSVEQQLVLLN